MITRDEYRTAQEEASRRLGAAGIILTREEANRIEVADFGLGNLLAEGLQLITYVNTERVCAKDLVLTPGQTCPEHRHPPVGNDPGKEETFRCRAGHVFVYLEGSGSREVISGVIPQGSASAYTVFGEYLLHPGDQVTIPPDTLHWFQAGTEGAVVSEFSTRSRDESDIFTDPRIGRETRISE